MFPEGFFGAFVVVNFEAKVTVAFDEVNGSIAPKVGIGKWANGREDVATLDNEGAVGWDCCGIGGDGFTIEPNIGDVFFAVPGDDGFGAVTSFPSTQVAGGVEADGAVVLLYAVKLAFFKEQAHVGSGRRGAKVA